jgi:hypothetical protein
MRTRLRVGTTVALLALSSDAVAHGEGAVYGPIIWAALASGTLAGVGAGVRDAHPGVGFAWSILLLFAAILSWLIWRDDAWWSGFLLGIPFIIFVGALPLAFAYFATWACTVVLKEYIQRRFNRASRQNEP